jgi:hypothetical protein
VISITNTGVTSFTPGIIVNADINAAAAIATTKLAALNPNIVPITNGSGFLISSALSPTTLGYVDIGSSLTGLLNLKLTDPTTTVGDLIIRNALNVVARLGVGTNGQVLTVSGGVPTWQSPSGVLNTVVIEIGAWDMTSGSINVAHGIADYKKIRSVSVIVRNDADNQLVDLLTNGYGGSESAAGIGGFFVVQSTNVVLFPGTGCFNTALFNDGALQRGWITIEYSN